MNDTETLHSPSTTSRPNMEDTTGATLDFDVIVVGLGPVGATLAGLLGLRGLRVAAIERDVDVFALPRAAHIDHQGLRVLQELGVLEELIGDMRINPGLDFVNAEGELLMAVPAMRPSRSGLPTSMYFYQPVFDRRLRELVGSLDSVEVLLGHELTRLEQTTDRVTATAVGPDGPVEVRAQWLVGVDGASSTVRDLVGVELESLNFDEQWLVVDVGLDGPHELPLNAVHVCDPKRPHTVIPMPEPRYRFELMVLPGEDPVAVRSERSVVELLTPWVDPDVVAVERSAVYEFHGLVAHEWRRGRVFLAGDAAHQMPPFLGQGMCSGMRDAANLAWKLDAVRAGAVSELLDTYQEERRPHVRQITEDVVEFGHIISTLDPEMAARRDLEMLAGRTRAPFGLPKLQPGQMVGSGGGALGVQPTAPAGDRLDDLVGQRFLVLLRDLASADDTLDWWLNRPDAVVLELSDLGENRAAVEEHMNRAGADVMVVRPDRYVMGAGTELAPFSVMAQAMLSDAGAAGQVLELHREVTL